MMTGFIPWAALELRLVDLQNLAKVRRGYCGRVQLEEGKDVGKRPGVPLSLSRGGRGGKVGTEE